MEYMDKTGLHLAASKDCCVIVGRHPQSGDTFYEEEIAARKDIFLDNGKKTVALHSRGREAFYVSVLEVDEEQLSVRDIQLKGNKELELIFFDGTTDCYQVENFCNKCEIPVISYIEQRIKIAKEKGIATVLEGDNSFVLKKLFRYWRTVR